MKTVFLALFLFCIVFGKPTEKSQSHQQQSHPHHPPTGTYVKNYDFPTGVDPLSMHFDFFAVFDKYMYLHETSIITYQNQVTKNKQK